uniref:Uncharacterized protein n=1 Tax=Kalanchoe fedtschenkoi TaxID=63787 RepID=A0A7N0VMC9_KALFE
MVKPKPDGDGDGFDFSIPERLWRQLDSPGQLSCLLASSGQTRSLARSAPSHITIASLTFKSVRSESGPIYLAHKLHFETLVLLFVGPFSFIVTSYSSLQNILHFPVIFPVSCTLAAFSLFILATGSTTLTVFRAFYGHPVSISAVLKSLTDRYIPLSVTLLSSMMIQLLICSLASLMLFSGLRIYELFGFEQVQYSSSPYFIGTCSVFGLMLLTCLFCLQASWSLASVIVLVEEDYSGWGGIEPLVRSARLVTKDKTTRRVAVWLLLLFWFGVVCVSLLSYLLPSRLDSSVMSVSMKELVPTFFLSIYLLSRLIGNAVLYRICTKMNEGILPALIAAPVQHIDEGGPQCCNNGMIDPVCLPK